MKHFCWLATMRLSDAKAQQPFFAIVMAEIELTLEEIETLARGALGRAGLGGGFVANSPTPFYGRGG